MSFLSDLVKDLGASAGPIIGAFLALAGVVVNFILTQIATSFREGRGRRQEIETKRDQIQFEALLEVQDAMLVLQELAWSKYYMDEIGAADSKTRSEMALKVMSARSEVRKIQLRIRDEQARKLIDEFREAATNMADKLAKANAQGDFADEKIRDTFMNANNHIGELIRAY